MPYASDRQRRFFHTDTARRKGIKPSTVEEFDKASKGKKYPVGKAIRKK
jgi:DNA relaxase NicK